MLRNKSIPIWIIRFCLLLPAFLSLGWGMAHRQDISALAPPVPTATAAEGPVAVYFSRPEAFDGEYAGGPDEILARAVDSSLRSVDVASYDFDLLSVARALLRASQRGVAVRIVVDSDNYRTEALDLLRGDGIPVVGDERAALMHDKFVVIDGEEVWAGSMNLTVNDAYRNDNNLLRIRSAGLAEAFTAEFEEMFAAKRFGVSSPAGKPAAAIETGAGPVEVLFAPGRPAGDRTDRGCADGNPFSGVLLHLRCNRRRDAGARAGRRRAFRGARDDPGALQHRDGI
jgi:hypothetical protein